MVHHWFCYPICVSFSENNILKWNHWLLWISSAVWSYWFNMLIIWDDVFLYNDLNLLHLYFLRLSSGFKSCLPRQSTKKLPSLQRNHHKAYSVHLTLLPNFRYWLWYRKHVLLSGFLSLYRPWKSLWIFVCYSAKGRQYVYSLSFVIGLFCRVFPFKQGKRLRYCSTLGHF